MNRLIVLCATACLIAAPLAIAQTTPPPNPPATTTPTTPPTPSTPGSTMSSGTSATPETPTTPTPATPSTGDQSASTPQGCHTTHEAGSPCACLSDTSRVGTSTASANGNICVRPS